MPGEEVGAEVEGAEALEEAPGGGGGRRGWSTVSEGPGEWVAEVEADAEGGEEAMADITAERYHRGAGTPGRGAGPAARRAGSAKREATQVD
jgi:hypothetical protein